MMGAEDFSYVLQKTPGVMVMLGVSPKGGDWRTCCPLHSNRMVLEEAMMAMIMAPDLCHQVMERATRSIIVWALAQLKHGCDAIKISSPSL